MKFLGNKTPQVYFENIQSFILALISTDKAQLVKVNGYGAIYANDEAIKSLFALHLSHIHFKNMCNHMETN